MSISDESGSTAEGAGKAGSAELPEGATPEGPGGAIKAKSDDATSFEDVKQLGLVASIASLGYVFWVVGGMEMIERLAYYGVRAVATGRRAANGAKLSATRARIRA